ncbi:MAG: hypothetical protein C0404_06550 [Verrucomicrobia bacterium]|nr:hypothetical protein [Verrucomicrobiota bacterium]
MSLLGIDIGTTGCKAASFSLDGRCLAQAYREYDTFHPEVGWAELDSVEVWEKTKAVIAEVAAATRADPVTALSVSAFGEAFVPVTASRGILDNTILCVDDRGREHSDRLAREFGQERFYSANPNILGTSYSLPKMMWLRDHRPEIYGNADYILLWSDLAAFMLGCEPVTNNSHANRTLLFDFERNDWSDELLAWSGIPRSKLGRIVCGGDVIGKVAPAMAGELGLPGNVTVVAGGHDQCCNALGCGAIRAGDAVCGMGTFECITPVYARPDRTLDMLAEGLNIEHHVLPGLYVSFIFNQGGALVKWFRDTFAAHEPVPAGTDIYGQLAAEMPLEPTHLLVLPHFQPPVSPRFIEETAGIIMGLRTTTQRGEILKAIMECTTLYFVDSIAALRRIGADTTEFIASGGGARSDAWLQIKADIFGVPFIRPRMTEGGVLGAAMLAGMATGCFSSAKEAVGVFVERDRVFEPDATRHAIYREKHALYRQVFDANHNILKHL